MRKNHILSAFKRVLCFRKHLKKHLKSDLIDTNKPQIKSLPVFFQFHAANPRESGDHRQHLWHHRRSCEQAFFSGHSHSRGIFRLKQKTYVCSHVGYIFAWSLSGAGILPYEFWKYQVCRAIIRHSAAFFPPRVHDCRAYRYHTVFPRLGFKPADELHAVKVYLCDFVFTDPHSRIAHNYQHFRCFIVISVFPDSSQVSARKRYSVLVLSGVRREIREDPFAENVQICRKLLTLFLKLFFCSRLISAGVVGHEHWESNVPVTDIAQSLRADVVACFADFRTRRVDGERVCAPLANVPDRAERIRQSWVFLSFWHRKSSFVIKTE